MLNMIKNIIHQKHVISEATDLILEEDELVDSIILSEEPTIDQEVDEALADKEDEDNATDEEKDEIDDKSDDDSDDRKSDDFMDDEMDDDLPEPVGRQTDEPAEIGDDDFLSTEIDLRSNTPRDILPTPPASAIDAVTGDNDILNQRMDSGFGEDDSRDPEPDNEEVEDILDMEMGDDNIDESPEDPSDDTPANESFDIMNEEMDAEEECGDNEECGNCDTECGETDATTETEESPKDKDNKPIKDDAPRKAKFDKDVDIRNMTLAQIKANINPGIAAKLEAAGILDQYIEAISVGAPDTAAGGGDDMSDLDNATAALDAPAGSDPNVGGDPNAAPADGTQPQSDNVVTAAVKDKVSEMNANDSSPINNGSDSKEALLKKASSLTKGLEDLKNQILNSNQL